MKTNRNGQALVLSTAELDLLIEELPGGVHTVLASVCRRTGCRISEARQLKWENIFPGGITFPKSVCKNKLESRTVPIFSNLYDLLMEWKKEQELIKGEQLSPGAWVFVGRFGDKPITRQAHGKQLQKTIKRLGLLGVSSHSYRRSALTSASSKGLPLKAIQTLSGHKSLAVLSKYLEVSEQERMNVAQAFA
jgi:integrase/recombinase XerD|tara:strand:+ start:207 stop:782 length:576 start_codon:yes stop_codon:yes gene_type:complete